MKEQSEEEDKKHGSSLSRPILLSKEDLMKNDALYHKF